jgi:hypothetical protein
MPNLSDKDRQALQLAGDLQKALDEWAGRRGVGQSCTVSPFVDPTGEPAVIIKMTAPVADAMIDSLRRLDDRPLPPPPPSGAGPADTFPGGPSTGPPGPNSPSGYFPFKP